MTALERVRAAYRAVGELDRPGLWITLVGEQIAQAQAEEIDRRKAAGEDLPLAGMVGALKDNIDLAGVPTTAGCPAFSYLPEASAFCVRRLVEAGLVFIGKTNLDQFATGLVGTRSPYGALSCVTDPARVSGGSSSGSAVAVALGIVDVALGTDTAGSGRVPAAFNGIVGLKPTHGLVSARGVVPACPTLDCVSFFARDVATAHRVFGLAAAVDREYPFSRAWSLGKISPTSSPPIVGVAAPSCLEALDTERVALYESATARLAELGIVTRIVDVDPLLDAGALLYGGGFVAERYAAVGEFIDAHRDEVEPTVGAIIASSKDIPAHVLAADRITVADALRATRELFSDVDVLVLPTTGEHPTIAEVGEDPIGTNARLGRFTNFCNLLDLAALSAPMPTAESKALPAGERFGVTFFAPAFNDQRLAEIAARYLGEQAPLAFGPTPPRIVVVGAHLRGEPLNYQLTDRGARLVALTTTSDSYRMYALDTQPPKPGLVRHAPGAGSPLEVEVWEFSAEGFSEFVGDVVAPLAIGPVELADGVTLPGFVLAAAEIPPGAVDITEFGGWRAHLANGSNS